MPITGTVYGNDYNYITIGNFEPKFQSFVPFNGTPDFMQTYYFIDSVTITEIPVSDTCHCGSPFYTFNYQPSANQTDITTCCYDFTLKVQSDPLNLSCPLINFKIKAINPNYPNDPSYEYLAYDNQSSVSKGTTINGSFCIPKIPYGPTIQIRIDYYNTLSNVKCSDNMQLMCKCGCGNGVENLGNFNWIFQVIKSNTLEDGKCCYDVCINNDGPCTLDDDALNYLGFLFLQIRIELMKILITV